MEKGSCKESPGTGVTGSRSQSRLPEEEGFVGFRGFEKSQAPLPLRGGSGALSRPGGLWRTEQFNRTVNPAPC